MIEDVLPLSSPASSFSSIRMHIAAAMASVTKTDTPSLKRTYTLVSSSNPPSPSDSQDRKPPFKVAALSPSAVTADNRMSLSLKRRYPFCKSQGSLSVSGNTSRSTVPAFVSIFDTDMSGCSPVKETTIEYPSFTDPVMTSGLSVSLQHKSHSSVSTSASSSNNSSPTTTISTVESGSSEDRDTPDSSPDTPEGLMVLPPLIIGGRMSNNAHPPIIPPSPSKKPRNTKNLSLNVPPSPSVSQMMRPMDINGQPLPTPKSVSAPSSPAFIIPPPPQGPRRRPGHLGLTIKLPGTFEKPGSLRHHQSSPSLFSPARGPIGGMVIPQSASAKQTTFQFNQRPTLNNRWASETIPSEPSSSSTNSPPKSPEILHEVDGEDDDEPLRSGEAKSPAYPQGPSLIFEPNIYLYSEPNAELASQFDVIINVAREVLNPFKVAANIASADVPIPDTACTDASFRTAFEEAIFSPVRSGAETPKPKGQQPEYVHMPWDHNTPILDDLPKLVELINERSNQGKKVLVHCQCGVSRSATLLIAYSMFKNPEKSMQDAYSAVKAKSRWIGPNMSLIYQLTDWKKMIATELPKTGWRNGPQTGGLRLLKGPGGSNLGRGRGIDSEEDTASLPEPQTAPLPGRRTSPSVSPMMPPSEQLLRPQVVRTRSENGGFTSSMPPGPSSAPSGMSNVPGSTTSTHNRQSWPDGDAKFYAASTGEPSPQPQRDVWPSKNLEPSEPNRMPPPPPPPSRPSNSYSLEKSGFHIPGQFESDIDGNMPPPTPAIASPRNSSGYWSTVPSRRMSPWAGFFSDPRSPTERGSTTPVIRNIFDVL